MIVRGKIVLVSKAYYVYTVRSSNVEVQSDFFVRRSLDRDIPDKEPLTVIASIAATTTYQAVVNACIMAGG